MTQVNTEIPENDRLQDAVNRYYEESEQLATKFKAFCWENVE